MQNILGELEQKIMNILWKSDVPLRPAQVQERLNSELAYTTVMTVLKRLHDKKILKRSKSGNSFLYEPLKEKSTFLKSKLSYLFTNLLDSYGELAISNFVDTIKDNPEDLEQLRKYLDEQK